MDKWRTVNDNGLRALKDLSYETPRLFIEPDTDALQRRMEERADTDNLWGEHLDIQYDLSVLNTITEGGPGTDAAFAPRVRQALGHLPPAEGLNDYRWAAINCFVIPQYVKTRWPLRAIEANDTKKLSSFVQRHWLDGHKRYARQGNAIARLWWLGELSSRGGQTLRALRSRRYSKRHGK